MAMEKLEEFVAYQKCLELFDLVVEDMSAMERSVDTNRLRSQQIASVDSICSNMEEGSGRWSKREYAQFLIIARGSAVESMGRYKRMRRWLPEQIVQHRVELCNEIISILTTTVVKLKRHR